MEPGDHVSGEQDGAESEEARGDRSGIEIAAVSGRAAEKEEAHAGHRRAQSESAKQRDHFWHRRNPIDVRLEPAQR
jgi:hypothetical protein